MGEIKGLLKEEMPRERLFNFGPESLSEVELLAIILRTGTKDKNVVELSREILEKFDHRSLSRKSVEELLKFKGIKEVKATQIVAIFELARRFSAKKVENQVSISSSEEIYQLVKYDFDSLNIEKVMIVFVNTKNKVIKKEIIHEGTLNYSIFDIRKIIKKTLSYDASGIFLIHNHPSGDTNPSSEDVRVTKKISSLCAKLSIRFLDHIIVGDNYYSFYDEGGL